VIPHSVASRVINVDTRHHSPGYRRIYLFDLFILEAAPLYSRGYPRVALNDRASLATEDRKDPEGEDQARNKRFQIVGIASTWIGRRVAGKGVG
jgi:hypothetical protein